MYHKMHDGPTHLSTGPRNYQAIPKAKPRASLVAIQCAADRANQSYGAFSFNLSPEDEARIQAEYETYKADREAAAEACRTGHIPMTDDQLR